MCSCFLTRKQRFRSKPVLYAPNYQNEFILQTDASDTNLGILLAEINDQAEEYSIAHAHISRILKTPEWKYCTTENECVAIVYSVEKLQGYLDGHLPL